MTLNHHLLSIVAGPCSAETEEQVFETAKALKAIGIEQLRAGVWKPRTRGGVFEGVGEVGLLWLQRVQQELGMQVMVEVATPRHVELALRYGIDKVWIGARSTTNPFSVQEIADSLREIDIPVYVKNPVCPDAELWIGAIERLQLVGIKDLTAIHRGFMLEDNSPYRNSPLWKIPLQLKKHFPDLKILCDPSHISGNTRYIEEIARQAIQLQFDGLFIESHICPQHALTDASQQLIPDDLSKLIELL